MLHDPGYGFDLIFTFEKNDYFKNASLKKSFLLTRQNIIEKCEGTEIEWKDGKDVTKKKIKKKQKAKKNKPAQTITKIVDQESFFNFFKTRVMPDEKELEEGVKKEPKEDLEEGEEPEKDVAELMDEDFDLGNEFKDQLIPLSLEYYLEVIEDEEDDDDDDDCCDDDECDDKKQGAKKGGDKGGESDEDEDKPAKGKKKKGGKGGEAGDK